MSTQTQTAQPKPIIDLTQFTFDPKNTSVNHALTNLASVRINSVISSAWAEAVINAVTHPQIPPVSVSVAEAAASLLKGNHNSYSSQKGWDFEKLQSNLCNLNQLALESFNFFQSFNSNISLVDFKLGAELLIERINSNHEDINKSKLFSLISEQFDFDYVLIINNLKLIINYEVQLINSQNKS